MRASSHQGDRSMNVNTQASIFVSLHAFMHLYGSECVCEGQQCWGRCVCVEGRGGRTVSAYIQK